MLTAINLRLSPVPCHALCSSTVTITMLQGSRRSSGCVPFGNRCEPCAWNIECDGGKRGKPLTSLLPWHPRYSRSNKARSPLALRTFLNAVRFIGPPCFKVLFHALRIDEAEAFFDPTLAQCLARCPQQPLGSDACPCRVKVIVHLSACHSVLEAAVDRLVFVAAQ